MAYFNQIQLLGNLTREPEVKFTQGGMAICTLGLAANKKRTGKADQVLFVDVTLFDKKAQVAGEYLHKGSQVLISGELVLDQWEKDGVKRSKHHIVANDFQMIGGKRDESSQVPPDENYPQAPAKSASPPSDDIPF